MPNPTRMTPLGETREEKLDWLRRELREGAAWCRRRAAQLRAEAESMEMQAYVREQFLATNVEPAARLIAKNRGTG